LRFYRAS